MEYECLVCGFKSSEPGLCPRCRIPLMLKLNVRQFKLRELPGIWKFIDALPRPKRLVSLGEGFTRVIKVNGIYVKYEGSNPTGTHYDRGSAVFASTADMEFAELAFEEDLTRSLALYLSSAGIKVNVSIGDDADPRDVISLVKMGANICVGCSLKSMVSYFNPLLMEGYKTIAYELAIQLRDRLTAVAIPVERGSLILSLIKGFMELEDLGLSPNMPKITASLLGEIDPNLQDSLKNLGVRLIHVKPDDALNAVVELARRRIWAKPISASPYVALKGTVNEGVAVISGYSKIRINIGQIKGEGRLQRIIVNAMPKGRPMTAYEVWKLVGSGTLMGVYKALNSLAAKGVVKVVEGVNGRRKVRYYIKP